MTLARLPIVSRRAILAVILGAAAAAPATAQSGTLDERQFRAARDLERSGQIQQAEEIYRQIVDSRPGSDRADDALLALARIAWPVDRADRLAADSSPLASIISARSSLELLRKSYPGGDAAAEGLWRLALTYLVPDPRAWRPEEAAALLTTLPVLYPEAPEVPGSLALAAELDVTAGRASRASELAFRIVADWPHDPSAAHAWIVMGRVDFAAGRFDDALSDFAAARRAAVEDEGGAALHALELSTLVDRAAYASSRAGDAYRPDRAARALPDKVSDLACDADGRLLASLPREDTVIVVGAGGEVVERRPFVGPSAVAVDAWGRPWVAREAGLTTPSGDPVPVPPKTRIDSIAPVDPGTVWVVDGRARQVLRAAVGAGVSAKARLPERATPVRVAPVEDGGAWVLTERPSTLVRIGFDGLPRSTIRLEELVREPVDLERDRLGHLYVLDRRALAVLVLGEDGRLVHRIELARPDGGVTRPEAIAVDGSGAVAVYDGREKRIFWFR